ncbi:hypothetical protein GQR58_002668 [Nymphon striatum]|nr:hypothetical protein GQR58_002668 [Nymphon striatum]
MERPHLMDGGHGYYLPYHAGEEHIGVNKSIASHGGECFQYVPEELHHVISVTEPPHLQGNHEEADTLIAFHVANITASHTIVRASDTDVLVILIDALGQQRLEVRSMTNIIMDCGMGNSRSNINVSNIANILEESKSGLPRVIPTYHAFTGCYFTSAFYRKGKVKPYDIMKNDETGQFVDLFISMGDITGDVASEFVCRMYAQTKTRDVNAARYNKLVDMTGKPDKNDRLQPIWFEGLPAPDSLFRTTDNKEAETEVESDSDETIITGMDDETGNERSNLDELSDSDDDPWSEDSGSDQEDEMD